MNDKLIRAFESLEIPTSSTLEEAKLAWRDLAQVWHPDKHQGNVRLQLKATEKLKEINGAWDEIKTYFASPNHDYEDRHYTRNQNTSNATETGQQTRGGGKYKTFTCPYCGAANKILRSALIELAKCSSCGKYLSRVEEEKEQARRAEFNKQRERHAEQQRREAQDRERELRRKEAQAKHEQELRNHQDELHIETEESRQPAQFSSGGRWFRWRKQYNWLVALGLIVKIATYFVVSKSTKADTAQIAQQKIQEKARYEQFQPTKQDQKNIDKFKSTFVKVPSGCFTAEDKNVCIDGFLISKYEVTQGVYKSVMGENPSFFDSCGDDCPVEQVSWDDAQLFINRINNKTGKHFRLPTEAEWEYACRSGGKNEKYCGGDNIDDVAWHKGNSGDTTHHVGQKNPNSLGLFDMTGNAVEWVNDWYSNSYPSGANNPPGPLTGSKRALRGGAAISEPVNNRVTQRGALAPDTRSGLTGFRVVSPIKE